VRIDYAGVRAVSQFWLFDSNGVGRLTVEYLSDTSDDGDGNWHQFVYDQMEGYQSWRCWTLPRNIANTGPVLSRSIRITKIDSGAAFNEIMLYYFPQIGVYK
jgi:hypothetical protein